MPPHHLLTPAEDPYTLELSAFKAQVLGPFILSESEHALACSSGLSHDGAAPTPEPDDGQEMSMASGGSSGSGGSGGGAAAAAAKRKEGRGASKL